MAVSQSSLVSLRNPERPGIGHPFRFLLPCYLASVLQTGYAFVSSPQHLIQRPEPAVHGAIFARKLADGLDQRRLEPPEVPLQTGLPRVSLFLEFPGWWTARLGVATAWYGRQVLGREVELEGEQPDNRKRGGIHQTGGSLVAR